MEHIDYKEIFDNSSAMMVVVDTSFVVVSITDAYLIATNSERKNIVGRSIFSIFNTPPATVTTDTINDILVSFKRVIEYRLPDNNAAIIQYTIQRQTLPNVG